MNAHDLTVAALAEVSPRVHAAVVAAGPNRAGDSPLGALGFMLDDDLVVLARAACLAHARAETPLAVEGQR